MFNTGQPTSSSPTGTPVGPRALHLRLRDRVHHRLEPGRPAARPRARVGCRTAPATARLHRPGHRQQRPTGNFLYAADFHNGKIDVFDATFQPTTLAGDFTDPTCPRRSRPFNVQNLGGKLYVTYARQDRDGDGAARRRRRLRQRLRHAAATSSSGWRRAATSTSPWGLALAPADFGDFGGALLVGNHGDGRINAFDPATGEFLGALRDERGKADPHRRAVGPGVRQRRDGRRHERPVLRRRPRRRSDGLFGSLRFAQGQSLRDVVTAVIQRIAHDDGPRFVAFARGLSGAGTSLPSLLTHLGGDSGDGGGQGGEAQLRQAVAALERLFEADDLFDAF